MFSESVRKDRIQVKTHDYSINFFVKPTVKKKMRSVIQQKGDIFCLGLDYYLTSD